MWKALDTIFLERTREGYHQSDEHWNRFEGNVGETSERCGGAYMGFSERVDTILNWTELNKTRWFGKTPTDFNILSTMQGYLGMIKLCHKPMQMWTGQWQGLDTCMKGGLKYFKPPLMHTNLVSNQSAKPISTQTQNIHVHKHQTQRLGHRLLFCLIYWYQIKGNFSKKWTDRNKNKHKNNNI